MKIYTKTGDKGSTSLIGGKRIPKYDLRIEAYGTVDELIAHIGLLRDCNVDQMSNDALLYIQDRLMTCASILATEENYEKIPVLTEEDIRCLEIEIDRLDNNIEPLKTFVLPGGHTFVSYAHIARTICRRAERRVIELSEKENVQSTVTMFLNRLSDYLFTLARYWSKKTKSIETPWKPRL
ncbi:MAG: ATP:cob(I)alamin adenosyltransferase [Marinilabiliales bacterium]|nr:MAG: ATP:cob(I)alamin adenosyltransferase [Marinilabiliales bacterium]